MRLYPDLAGPRNRQITRDMFVLLSLALFAFFAWAVKKAVMTLTAISAGFTDNAQGVEDSWDSIGGSLAGIPFVGDDIQGALSDLSDATVGNAVEAGRAITEAVTTTANVLAFVTFAAPAAVLLVLYLPRRLDRSRAWTAADTVLSAIEVNPALGWPTRASGPCPVRPRSRRSRDSRTTRSPSRGARPGVVAGGWPGAGQAWLRGGSARLSLRPRPTSCWPCAPCATCRSSTSCASRRARSRRSMPGTTPRDSCALRP